MKKIVSIVTVILMATMLMIGCASKEEEITVKTEAETKKETTVENDNKDEIVEVEKEIDTLIVGEIHDINTGFVPTFKTSEGWGCFYYLGNFYETLVNYDHGEIVPGLATSWEVNKNELIFKLREDVMFTDGSEFNAEAVKKTFDMMPKVMDKQYAASFLMLTMLEEVEVIDEYTVKFILSEPYYGALQELSMVHPMGIVASNAYTEEGLSEEVYNKTYGTGKYMIENAVEGEDYTFVRNDNYWGEKPKVKQFTVKTVPDTDSRMMALKKGEVDMIFGTNNITYDAFAEFEADNRFLTKISEGEVKTVSVRLNTAKAPFDDVKVRRSVQYAIDKQQICDSLLYGIEEKADYLFNTELPYCDVDLEPYYYDVEKAKEILNEAGWLEVEGSNVREKNGEKLKTFVLYRSGLSSTEDLTLAIVGQLEAIGFEIEMIGLDTMAFMNEMMGGNFGMFVKDSFGIPYEPYVEIASMNEASGHNQTQQGLAEKAEIDAKIDEVSSMTNQDDIQEVYNYILGTLHDEAVYIPISYKKELAIFNNDKIQDYIFNGQTINIDISGIVPK